MVENPKSMKLNFILLGKLSFLVIVPILFQNCVPTDEDSSEFEKWTSTDPLSINYKTRKQKFDHKNLVFNNSFELGKIKQLDSTTQSTKVDGWELIGESVTWINSECDSVLDNPDEVHSGLHSIHIHREYADETETIGQGILSDYIKVLPGNYLLSLYLNLKNIENPKSRLGTKIHDAVDIRILYYDRNKIQINREHHSVHYQTTIDNSFKGYSFANFNEIDSTGWLHIIGRSHIFPFPDGDLQDDTKFVRIFVGLKGTGDLWADDISFEYTKWNFTTLERLSPYFDSTLSKSDLIVPQPIKVFILESVIYYRPYYEGSFPAILIPSSPDRITLNSAKRFEKGIKQFLIDIAGVDSAAIPNLIKEGDLSTQENASIIFSLGNNNLFKKHADQLPLDEIKDKPQGFFIHTLSDFSNTIFLYGNSSSANYYAIQAALQLFDNRRLLFHNANVIDYPEKNERSLLITNVDEYALEFFRTSNQTRFSSVYLPASSVNTSQVLADGKDQGIFSKWLYYEIDPSIKKGHSNLTIDNSELKRVINKYTGKIDGLAVLFHSPLLAGITLHSALDQYKTSNKHKECGFNSGSLNALINSVSVPVEIMPCYSNNICLYSASCHSEYNISKENNYGGKNISFIWSGFGLQSWRLDEADLFLFKKKSTFPTVFIDFTLYPKDRNMRYYANDTLFPYKLLTSSLFEPFENEIVPEVYEKVDKVVLAYNVSNILDRVRLQTASDFFWNQGSYNADLSLYKALVSEFGTETAQDLLRFNDLYFKIKSELILANIQKSSSKQHIRKASNLLNEIRIIQSKLYGPERANKFVELTNILASLVRELELMKAGLEESFSSN